MRLALATFALAAFAALVALDLQTADLEAQCRANGYTAQACDLAAMSDGAQLALMARH